MCTVQFSAPHIVFPNTWSWCGPYLFLQQRRLEGAFSGSEPALLWVRRHATIDQCTPRVQYVKYVIYIDLTTKDISLHRAYNKLNMWYASTLQQNISHLKCIMIPSQANLTAAPHNFCQFDNKITLSSLHFCRARSSTISSFTAPRKELADPTFNFQQRLSEPGIA